MIQTPLLKTSILETKPDNLRTTKLLLTTAPNLNRGLTEHEAKIMTTDYRIPTEDKLFYNLCYETMFRPFEVLNLLIEDCDKVQKLVTARRVKQKWDRRNCKYLPSLPRTAVITDKTNELLRSVVGNRKKGCIFINTVGKLRSLRSFEISIDKWARLIGIQKEVRTLVDGKKVKLITCMALREAGERHHDNDGGSRKLSAVAAGHGMRVKEKHYEKVGGDFEQVHKSIKEHHPAWRGLTPIQ